ITYHFRMEHSLMMLLFPLAHLYYNRENYLIVKKLWPAFVFLGLGLISVILFMQSKDIFIALEGFEKYDKYTVENLDNSGLGSKLYSLPFGVKQIALVLNSQLTPLPPW